MQRRGFLGSLLALFGLGATAKAKASKNYRWQIKWPGEPCVMDRGVYRLGYRNPVIRYPNDTSPEK